MEPITIIIAISTFFGGGVISYFAWDFALVKKKKKKRTNPDAGVIKNI